MRVHNRIMAFSVMEIRRAMLRLRWWLTTLDEVVKHVLLCQGDPLDHTRAAAAGTQAEVEAADEMVRFRFMSSERKGFLRI